MRGSSDICFDIETTGLDPLKDRVTAVGIKTKKEEVIFTHRTEKRILEQFWNYVRRFQFKRFRLIGFNCYTFDIPFLIIRSFKHDVKAVDVRGRVVDLRYILSYRNRYRSGTLENFSKLIRYRPKYNGYCAKDIPLLWKEKKIDELIEYLRQDARMTYVVYKRLREIDIL